jgi:hypothetical protein
MTDIAELFARDPMDLSKDPDIKEMVAYYREKRNQFQLGDTQAGSTKRMKKASGPKQTINIDIDEIII